MRLPPHKNMKSPPGQIVNPVPRQEHTLKDYIARKIPEDEKNVLTEYERGYQDGYYDAIVKGAK